MTIDAHVQFWKFNKNDTWLTQNLDILQQDYLPADFLMTAKRNDIEGVVTVESDQTKVDTKFLVELAKTNTLIKGVVGWIDLKSKTASEQLDSFSQYPVIKGWCYNLHNTTDDFLSQETLQQNVSQLQALNYTCDLLINHDQLPEVVQFFSRFPQLKCVVDHCAWPDIRDKNIDQWKFLIQEIAKNPNAFCKVSGLLTQAVWKQWSSGDFYPYLDAVFEAFGIDRLIYGSDWPCMLLSGIYVQWKSLLEHYMENFSTKNNEKVFGLNAVEFYGL